MSKLNQAIHEIHQIDEVSAQEKWINQIHPLPKVIVTVFYLFVVMSFDKYHLSGLASMCLYPLVLMITGDISAKRTWRQLKVILLAVMLIGLANPILDRTVIATFGMFAVTEGMVSMITLVMKAVLALFASYLLITTTSMENICYAFTLLHVPKILVTLILLIYRYVVLMLKEAERITQAYSMRAPGQKGIHYKAWGTLAGQMLLRSIDRAENVYESMALRGFHGEFYLQGKKKMTAKSAVYTILWCSAFLILRIFPVFQIAGKLFVP